MSNYPYQNDWSRASATHGRLWLLEEGDEALAHLLLAGVGDELAAPLGLELAARDDGSELALLWRQGVVGGEALEDDEELGLLEQVSQRLLVTGIGRVVGGVYDRVQERPQFGVLSCHRHFCC